MAIVYETYPAIKNFPKIEVAPVFVNIPIQTGIGNVITDPNQNSRPCIPNWLKELKEKERGFLPWGWEKDRRGIWIQSQRVHKSDIFWDRRKDGHHIKSSQIFCNKEYKKITIPAIEILDDDYGKNKERNDTIENIRDKFLRKKKTSRGNYENLGNYFYKSDYHKELFLEIIEALGLARKVERKKSTVELSPLEYYSRYMSNRYQEDEL